MASLHQNDAQYVLKLQDIRVNYGQIRALQHVNLRLMPSEVHALVGEHGAGKSSLGMIASGMLTPDSGSIIFDGQTFQTFSRKTAHELGIEIAHQHIHSLSDCFTIAENFFLTRAPFRKLLWKQEMINAATSFFDRYQIGLDPLKMVEDLTFSERIFVDILKLLYAQPKLLILDEVLEKLSPPALEKIISTLKIFKEDGLSILFITHSIDEMYNIADRISIIKNGEILLTDDVNHLDRIHLIKMAYMQLSEESDIQDMNTEFYQFLKYNEAILRNLPVNLIITDNDQRIKLVNEHCKHYFDLEKKSYLNLPLEQLFSSPNEEVIQLIKRAFASKEGKTLYQVPITFQHGTAITNITSFPIYDGSFRIGTILILEDVTEYDQLQKQVILSEKLASVGLLAAGVAHEINNPLEIIYNNLSYIKYNFQDAKLHEAIEEVHEEVSSITQIVSNLHSFSDNRASVHEELDINDLIRDIVSLLKYSARAKQIAITFEPYQDDILIRASKNEIKQVLLNLFKNSFEAMPSGGAISIHTLPVTEDGMQNARIQFRDTGSGIQAENPNDIFLPFFSTKKGQEKNLGLGLSVSYGIIKKYHGVISVENIDGSGCQFTITLPQAG